MDLPDAVPICPPLASNGLTTAPEPQAQTERQLLNPAALLAGLQALSLVPRADVQTAAADSSPAASCSACLHLHVSCFAPTLQLSNSPLPRPSLPSMTDSVPCIGLGRVKLPLCTRRVGLG